MEYKEEIIEQIEHKDGDDAGKDAEKGGEEQEKTFTKDELEKIVEKRLSRERKNTSELMKIKEMLGKLKEDGKLSSSSYSDMARELADLIAKGQNAKEAEETSVNEAIDSGRSFEDHPGAPNADKSSEGSEISFSDIASFIANFGEDELRRMMNDESFLRYCKNTGGTLSSKYLSYFDLIRRIRDLDAQKRASAVNSTGFSISSANGAKDYSSLLSKRQMDIADRAGMSYREYARILGQIPQSVHKKKSIGM